MQLKPQNPNSMIALRWNAVERAGDFVFNSGTSPQVRVRRGFTLLEVLLALIVLAFVLVAVHSVFYSAIQLRNKVDASIQNAMPLQHALRVIKRDVANLTVPGGTLTGTIQTPLIASSSTTTFHDGEQVSPAFYTASGAIDDRSPWSEMRKVTYYLETPTNQTEGLDLVRSVTYNLLPVMTEEYVDQRLLSGVQQVTFQFYDGDQWVDEWDSTTAESTGLSSIPTGIRVQLWMVETNKSARTQTPIQLVIPISVNATNVTESDTGGES